MVVKLEPLGDQVLVRPIEKEEVSKGGIILPDTAKEKPQEGEITAVGPGKLSDDGETTQAKDMLPVLLLAEGWEMHVLLG